MTPRFSTLLALSLALAASACSGGGGGGGGDALVEIFPPSATLVPESDNDRVNLSALVDGEPADVQWVVVGGGYVTVTDGPETTYIAPIDGIAAEPISVSVFAFADGGEGEALISLHDSAGILNIVYENYDVGPFGIGGPLFIELIDVTTNTVYETIGESTLGYEVPAGTYRADDSSFAPQYVVWGDVGVEGEYHLAPAATTVVPDDGEATMHVRWADAGTGMLWTVSGTSSLLGFTGPSLVPGLPAETRTVSSGADRGYADIVDTNGLMWTADMLESSLVGFNPSALGTGGQMNGQATVFNPTLMVGTTSSIATPTGVAFEALTGDLWYVNLDGTFGRFAAAQLADDAGNQSTPAPDAFFLDLPGRTSCYAIAVDGAGNVWITSGSDIHRYDAGDVAASGAPLPAAIYSGPWTSARALELDIDGNLWIGDSGANIFRIDAAQLAGTGPVAVTADLEIEGDLLTTSVEALEFDDMGHLYFSSGDHVYRIDAADAASAGVFLANSSYVELDAGATGLAFRRRPPEL